MSLPRTAGVSDSEHAADTHVRALQPSCKREAADIDRLSEKVKAEGEAREVLVNVAPRGFGPPRVGRQSP
jgi:hypothetical protein